MRALVWPVALLVGVGLVASLAGRAAARARGFWFPVAGIWLAIAVTQYWAVPARQPTEAVLAAVALVLSVGLAALVARAEVRRGRNLWRAWSVAFMLGATVGALTPLLVAYMTLMVTCAVTGNCL